MEFPIFENSTFPIFHHYLNPMHIMSFESFKGPNAEVTFQYFHSMF